MYYCSPPDGPRPPTVSVAPSAVVEEGSSLTLNCSSDANPEANYIWHKENEDLPLASGQSFTITDIQAEHNGYYYCVVWNIMGRANSAPHLVTVAGYSKLSSLVCVCELRWRWGCTLDDLNFSWLWVGVLPRGGAIVYWSFGVFSQPVTLWVISW